MKVTSERLPRSLMKLTVEMDEATVEKELDRAARSLSQKVRVPGFRPGKVPRPILERFYGRQALVEEASEGIINAGFRQALEQEGIEPIGQASLDDVQFLTAPYTFVIQIPVDPVTRIADYTDFRQVLEVPDISAVVLQRALDEARERHVVLREPEEARAVSQGDLVSAEVDAQRDGVSINGREPGQAAPSTDLILEPGRLVEGLMEGINGMTIGENRQISAFLPDDYANAEMRGAPVIFDVTLRRIQERILPDWEELPTLESFEGTLADFKVRTSDELAKNANTNSENRLINAFVDRLVAGAVYDYPDVAIQQEADRLLSTQEAEYTRYGTTAEAVYKQMGQDRAELVKRLLPEGEERLKRNLAMREFVLAEGLTVGDEEIDEEIGAMLGDYNGDQREAMLGLLRGQMVTSIANSVLDKKMRARIVEIATQSTGAAEKPVAAPKKRATTKVTEVATSDDAVAPTPKKKSTKKSE
ncbi:MAG: trigger factor [Chloroflexales bacterium]|nr:trigger factor [Chloroflexales bacterium]